MDSKHTPGPMLQVMMKKGKPKYFTIYKGCKEFENSSILAHLSLSVVSA